MAVYHPMIAVQYSRSLDSRRVRGGYLWLGHGKTLIEFTSDQGFHVVLSPFGRGIKAQHDGILQRIGAHRDRAQVRTADNLVHIHIIHKGHALAANVLWMAQGPQARILGLLLYSFQSCLAFGGILVEAVLEWIDHVFNELLDPAARLDPANVFWHAALPFV